MCKPVCLNHHISLFFFRTYRSVVYIFVESVSNKHITLQMFSPAVFCFSYNNYVLTNHCKRLLSSCLYLNKIASKSGFRYENANKKSMILLERIFYAINVVRSHSL